jgi:predicted DNA-binding transcriptional regulator YafY
MSAQPRFDRLLRLLLMLSESFGQSTSQLAEHLEITQRTVYRYIETLRESGFIISRQDDFFRVDRDSPYLKSISDLLHFTREEAWILNKAILALDDDTLIKQNLARKLYAIYDIKGVPYPVVKKENSERVVALIRAIEERQTVILKDYRSPSSNSISNRKVEPFEFTLNYGFIWCYEPQSHTNKLFKTARIGKVIPAGEGWRFEDLHKPGETDVFRISGPVMTPVKLVLSLRAANLLTEEYPMAEEFLSPGSGNNYYFSGPIAGFEGIGRFVLGLMDEIEIMEPEQFRRWLNDRVKKKKF